MMVLIIKIKTLKMMWQQQPLTFNVLLHLYEKNYYKEEN